jgi:hypothetical protein
VFKVEVLQGLGKAPAVLDASQLVVRMGDGTPVMLAAVFAQSGSSSIVTLAHCNDPDFQKNLQQLGITDKVAVSTWKDH